jgi:hypothetical protein
MYYLKCVQHVERQYRKLWSQNGDKISMLYAGTRYPAAIVVRYNCGGYYLILLLLTLFDLLHRALKQDYVRQGRRTLRGIAKDAVNSAIRYYLNIFEDTRRQRGVGLVIGHANNKLLPPSAVDTRSSISSPPFHQSVLDQPGVFSSMEEGRNEDLAGSNYVFGKDNTTILNIGNSTTVSASTILNNTVFEFQTLLTSRTSKVIAALDRVLHDNKALIAHQHEAQRHAALPVRIRLRNRAPLRPPPRLRGVSSSSVDSRHSPRLVAATDPSLHSSIKVVADVLTKTTTAVSIARKSDRLLLVLFFCLGALGRMLAQTS